jgi:hypothetical protein
MKRILLLMLFLLAALAVAPAAAQGTTFELGGQILTFLHPAEMHAAGMTWLKMQITYHHGGSTADAQNVINHARRNNFKVLLSIKGVKSELASGPAQYYQDYAAFLGQVAALNPDAIEVWNEPNIDAEWPAGLISGAAYAQMLSRAYPAIKAVNPNVMVISGAPAPTGYFGGGCAASGCDDLPFIRQMKTAHADSYFDCTGIHYNEGVLPPSATSGDPRGSSSHYTRYYPLMVSTYRGVFPAKPLCFTELGYISPDGLGGLPAGLEWGLGNTAQEQAAWLAQAATLSRDGGVVRLMIVWNVDAPFTRSNTMAGWAIIRAGGQCLPCDTLSTALSNGPKAAPVLFSPLNAALLRTGTPRLTWNSVSGATGYRIQVAANPSFTTALRAADPTGTSYAVSPALPDGLYYWRVRALNSDGLGPWSSPRQFTVQTQPPANAAPELNYYTSGSVKLTWSGVSWASGYEVQVDESQAFAAPLEFAQTVGANTLQVTTSPLPNGTHYWRVHARRADGTWSDWSPVQTFTVASP